MNTDFSSIRKLLLSEMGASLHRNIFILAGDKQWQKSSLQEILVEYESESLWVGEQDPVILPFVETKKSRSWLGNEKRVVVFDANVDFDSDSFAAISGIVVGGGLFFLLLPEMEKAEKVYSSLFGKRLLQSFSSPEHIIINQQDRQVEVRTKLPNSQPLQNCTAPFLTEDQQHSFESIKEQLINKNGCPSVLYSDRGRGKSAILGMVTAMLVQKGFKHIVITAPSLRSTDIIFKHIVEILPEVEIMRGGIKYKGSVIQFYAPDHLALNDVNADVLLVDEAAAIPVPVLTSFLHKFKQCVFATTVHGYEGTGRGFSLRFFKALDSYNSNWLKLNMKTPVRWAVNDHLEKWVFDLFCLDAETADIKSSSNVVLNDVEYKFLEKDTLFNNEKMLNEVFSLLVLAHYRTRPKDLMSLLDDESISLYVTFKNKHVIAVALVVQEGSFSNELSTFVYRGERRPQGHLLAQALTFHCGIENAATLDYARVMRIAVHPNLQNKGIGTGLLDFIVENERKLGRDAIGTSFGMTGRLLSFWETSGFNIIRIGFTREKTSGEHAAIMLLGLSPAGKDVFQKAYSRFNEQIPYWLKDILKDIPPEIKIIFEKKVKPPLELTAFDRKDIESYVRFTRNYELCIAALNKLVINNYTYVISDNISEKSCYILKAKIVDKKSWQEIRWLMELSGKNEARRLFNNAINELLTLL